MTQEALKLALEALETPWNAPYVDGCDLTLGKKVKAITAIKEALAQPTPAEYAMGYAEGFEDACKKPTWVGLTDREFEETTHGMEDLEDCWKAIENALRKKNNA